MEDQELVVQLARRSHRSCNCTLLGEVKLVAGVLGIGVVQASFSGPSELRGAGRGQHRNGMGLLKPLPKARADVMDVTGGGGRPAYDARANLFDLRPLRLWIGDHMMSPGPPPNICQFHLSNLGRSCS